MKTISRLQQGRKTQSLSELKRKRPTIGEVEGGLDLQGRVLKKGKLHRELQRSAEDPPDFWLGYYLHIGNMTRTESTNNSTQDGSGKIAIYSCKVVHCMFSGILFEVEGVYYKSKNCSYSFPGKILPSNIFIIFSLLHRPNCGHTSQL